MRFLFFSIGLIMIGCRSEYAALKPANPVSDCVQRFGRPLFQTAWFSATVDVYGRHLSGLLLVKRTDNGGYRTVFTNETGITFFDFELLPDGTHSAKKVVKQLDRKAVIKTLSNDMILLTGLAFGRGEMMAWTKGDLQYYGVEQKTGTAYFITDKDCASLQRLESGSRKPVVSLTFEGERYNPSRVTIRHLTFDMTIGLKKIERE